MCSGGGQLGEDAMNVSGFSSRGRGVCVLLLVTLTMGTYFLYSYTYKITYTFEKLPEDSVFSVPHRLVQEKDRDDLLALKMSLPIENKRPTAAPEGMTVLNLMNKYNRAAVPVEPSRGQNSMWWREVVCKRKGHENDGMELQPVTLMQLFRNVTPEKNNNVFLMDTACNPTPKYRVWCSVESWARQNPNRQVWFLLTAGRLEGNTHLTSTLKQQYNNLHMVTVDLNDMFRNTPLLSLFESRKWAKDNTWPVELLSDMLRVLVLWWWGGVYSDTDVISVRPLTLPANSLGFEHASQLGSAFYSFTAHHPALQQLMEDMTKHFKPREWGSIGPQAITRVMTEICGKRMPDLIPKAPVTCQGNITLHSARTFYPVRYHSFEEYFKPGGGKNFDQTYQQAFALHFWNKMSKNRKIEVNKNSVYEVVARRFCPITFQTATAHSDFF